MLLQGHATAAWLWIVSRRLLSWARWIASCTVRPMSAQSFMSCGWGVKAGMVRVSVAGKPVWFPCYTRAISERLSSGASHNKVLYTNNQISLTLTPPGDTTFNYLEGLIYSLLPVLFQKSAHTIFVTLNEYFVNSYSRSIDAVVSTARRRGHDQSVNNSGGGGQTSLTKPRVERLLTVDPSVAFQSVQHIRNVLDVPAALQAPASCIQRSCSLVLLPLRRW